MKRFASLLTAVLFCVPLSVGAKTLPPMTIVTPGYTLVCAPGMVSGRRLTLTCVASHTSKRDARAFFETYRYGDPLPKAMFAQFAPLGNGGPSVGAGDNSVTVTGGFNVAVNQANTFNFTAAQAISGAGNCGETGTPTYGALCLGRNVGTVAMIIGPNTSSPWNCVASCVAASSGQLCWYSMTGTGLLSNCPFVDTAGVLNVSKLKIVTSLNVGANPVSAVLKIGSNSACSGTSPVTATLNGLDCRVTAASSSAVFNFSTAYAAAPICTATDETTTTSALKVAVTTSGVTVTTPGASDVVDIICAGNGSV